MHNLNENQTAIISIISKFGCMSLQQVYDLLPSYSHKALQTFVTQLVKGHYIDIVDESYLVPYGKKSNYSHKTIDSLWVIMRLAHNNINEIREVLRAASPCDFIFTSNNTTTYKILTGSVPKISLLHDLMEQNSKKKKQKTATKNILYNFESFYVIIVTSKDIMQALKEYDFSAPVLIAYVKYKECDKYKPDIKILKKSLSEK